ncbi:hypothetical protein HSX37_14035|uniref:Uncharacterized protein n=1 Tax=Dendrosporobacter quercicolus TaxID=146817 RepID=A0A1G9WM43_9FIRM|nr:hypothetical protein [Dendrosporobacter quercicolus]NSL49150.1 hypothetical protein [Dendrosporobacter quercicolus DSM 1736]SDM85529.1 hypothetical protein SAMN04488502_10825 [Dendrosporobacter quercicolus]
MKSKHFVTTLNPISKTCLFLLLLLIPVAFLLPAGWGRENQPVENIQVLVLLAIGVVMYRAYRSGAGSMATKKLILWAIPLLGIVLLRELSWGRVFYPDGSGGFLPLEKVYFGHYVYPAIGAIAIAVVAGIFRQKLHQEFVRWFKYGKFPLVDILLIVGCFFAADFIEHSKIFRGQRQELFEELLELVMYIAVMSLFFNLGFNKDMQPASLESEAEKK